MEEFNNVEMTEEELDNVAGGVRTATFKLLEDGRIEETIYVDEREISPDGTVFHVYHDESRQVFQRKFLEKAIEKYTKKGYEIIKEGF